MKTPRVEFMGSDGILLDLDYFSGFKSILSGPAGGVGGYALTSWDPKQKQLIIGYVLHIRPSITLTNRRPQLQGWSCQQTFPILMVATKSYAKRNPPE